MLLINQKTPMIDNFDLIIPLLKFETENNFYFVQIIQRKKDHKEENKRIGRNNSSRTIKNYYIHSVEQLLEYKEEMIKLAEIFNARVGINLNPRNNRQIALSVLENLAASIKSETYNISRIYDSCCGIASGTDKIWIVDIDTKDELEITRILENIKLCEPVDTDKLIKIIPTKNGVHLITKTFNSQKFSMLNPGVDLHKNNPTCLFIP